MRWKSALPCTCLAAHRDRINIIVTVPNRSAEYCLGLDSRAVRNSNGHIRRVLFTPETERQMSILRPLFGRFLDVGAGGFGSARKIDEVSKNVERFVAFRINRGLFRVVGG